jgi:hypothetical protein
MRHRLQFILFTLITLLAFSLPVLAQDAEASADCIPAEGEPIRIGAIFPTGDLFSLDAAEPLQGVQAMIEAVNACGGGRPVELIHMPANNRDQALDAVDELGDVPLIIGSGSPAISEALTEASAAGDFVYWEVSEPLDLTDAASEWAFSPRPNERQLGQSAAQFVLDELPALIDGRVPRVALLYETRASRMADGILDVLQPELQLSYSNIPDDTYDFAVSIREQAIDVVMVATFEGDANHFWNTLRQADANIAAWVQIGSQLDNDCNSFAALSVRATGEVSDGFRQSAAGPIYDRYRQIYQDEFGLRGERADLAASGVYLLLTHILPRDTDQALTTENIRSAILGSDASLLSGLMGEGLDFETGINTAASPVIQQRQWDGFCSVSPGILATCTSELQSFPTWRDRAVAASNGVCGVDRGGIAFAFPFG